MSTIINSKTGGSDVNHNGTGVVYNGSGTRNKNLKFVDNLAEYQVHHNDTDIRGYNVRLASGETIGEVEGLLADVPTRLVRYAEVELTDDVINGHTAGHYTEEDRHVLIPIGLVEINDDRTVSILGIGLDQMVDYPRYNRVNGYTTNYEMTTNQYLGGFHDYRDEKVLATFSDEKYRQADSLDDTFYSSKFYTGKWTTK